MRRFGLALAAAGILALAMLCACGGHDDGDGGVTREFSIVGPDKVTAGSVAEYTAILTGDTATSWEWSIKGDGAIVGSNEEQSVKVRAAGGGKFTVRCMIKSATAGSEPYLKVNVPVPVTRFRVVLNNAPNFAATSLTGTGRLEMTSNDAEATTWAVYFEGDRYHLPAQVPVTVTTTNGQFTLINLWLSVANETRTLLFPSSGGGTVGNGGTVLNTGANRPDCIVGGPGESATVRLSAEGVETMTITVFYQ